MKTNKYSFEEFVKIIRLLRKECPWDREQTHKSIRISLIEEAYEVLEAIDKNDFKELKKELGDLLLQVVIHSVFAEEKGKFTINDVLDSITRKMIERHPHVFGEIQVKNSKEVKRNWEHIKLKEGRKSVIDGVPKEMPALLRAFRIQEKAAKVGFDWKKKKDVWEKVLEEMKELALAEKNKKKKLIEEEFGDLLFSLVNYSRFLGINPEFSLRASIEKFSKRFNHIEKELLKKGKNIEKSSLKEMDSIWNKVKKSK